ncbi:MAG TPA: lipid IV(A) 3-deoxy-D-manno-octulosonic acid transferase [Gammaproteobacteria bacterium]|nr:lipid IV(A) 3-deoxy-D-manno-octulosonic acid transferase [Gammaproteobacteria bacterium]
MRFFYSLALLLLMPVALTWLAWRTWRQTGRLDRVGERLGSFPYLPPRQTLWVHGASVGEIRAALPLVNALHRKYPQRPLLVTSFSGAGRAHAQELFGDRAMVAQLPYDFPWCVQRWMRSVQPAVGVIMETEIWPNLLAGCWKYRAPVVMVSARLSARSMRRYLKLRRLTRTALARVTRIAAQSAGDAERFVELGAAPERVGVGGNLKFDLRFADDLVPRAQSLRQRLFAGSGVCVAGSTREGEEQIVLRAFAQVCARRADSVLVLAPRHPERAEAVAALVRKAGFNCRRRSQGEHALHAGEVLLVDTLGELALFYAAGDVAFVGGSLVAVGGHNLLEPAALGKPVLAGSSLDNVRESAEALRQAGVLIPVQDAGTLADAVVWLLDKPEMRDRIGQVALDAVTANRGAVERALGLIESQVVGA